MRKSTVYLPDELKRLLERAAETEGRSEAALIREAVGLRVAAYARPRPRLPLTSAPFGNPDAARAADDLLRDGFGRGAEHSVGTGGPDGTAA